MRRIQVYTHWYFCLSKQWHYLCLRMLLRRDRFMCYVLLFSKRSYFGGTRHAPPKMRSGESLVTVRIRQEIESIRPGHVRLIAVPRFRLVYGLLAVITFHDRPTHSDWAKHRPSPPLFLVRDSSKSTSCDQRFALCIVAGSSCHLHVTIYLSQWRIQDAVRKGAKLLRLYRPTLMSKISMSKKGHP